MSDVAGTSDKYIESLLITKTSLEEIKETLLSWPENSEECETEVSSLRASIVELLCSMVHVLDSEREPEVDMPEHEDGVSGDGEQQDEKHGDGTQVNF